MSGRHGEKTERNVKATGEDVERADPLEVLDCAEIPRNKKKRKKKHYGRNFIIFLLIIGSAVAFTLSSVFNVKKFTVTGNYYYSDEEVIVFSGSVLVCHLVFQFISRFNLFSVYICCIIILVKNFLLWMSLVVGFICIYTGFVHSIFYIGFVYNGFSAGILFHLNLKGYRKFISVFDSLFPSYGLCCIIVCSTIIRRVF